MNHQYPEKDSYFCHKRRDIYGKFHKTLHFWLRQIQPMEILQAFWLNLRTQDSSYFFFFIFVEMLSSFDVDGLLLFSLRSIFQRSSRLIVIYLKTDTDFALF